MNAQQHLLTVHRGGNGPEAAGMGDEAHATGRRTQMHGYTCGSTCWLCKKAMHKARTTRFFLGRHMLVRLMTHLCLRTCLCVHADMGSAGRE